MPDHRPEQLRPHDARSAPAEDGPAPVRPLAAFAVANFRRFVIGQSISLVGSWTETVAQSLLILQLTGSGVWLGLGVAARYLPVLLLTPYAGVVVDRDNKRAVLTLSQTMLGLLSLILGVLVLTGVIRLWMVFVIALAFGTLTALDNPARLAFVPEMVGPKLIRNAITLNSTMVNVDRAVGPLVAATLIATIGIGWCFIANAMSFAAVLAALMTLNRAQLHPTKRVARARHQLREGLQYARSVPEIIAPLLMMILVGTFTYEFEVSLPLFARGPLHGDAATYSWLIGAFGAGSVIGGLYNTRNLQTGTRRMIAAASLYAAAMAATALTSTTWLAVALLIVVGMASITFITTGNSTIQLAATPEMRGRVTALWSTAFVGSTPIGSAIIGVIGDHAPRWTLFTGAAACALAAAVGSQLLHRRVNRSPGHAA
jgi:MFS family permease